MFRIAAELSSRRWQTFFLGPTSHRSHIEATGSTFIPLTGSADLDDETYYSPKSPSSVYRLVPGYADLPWWERVLHDFKLQCLDPLPTQWECVKETLRMLHERDPETAVIMICEAFFLGAMPLKYGAPLPPSVPEPKTLCVSVTIPAIRSQDLPPPGYPLPFDTSSQGRELNKKLWGSWAKKAAPLTDLLEQQIRTAGATRPVNETFLSGANYISHDTIVQLGVPGFDYPRTDWPSGMRFAGLVQGVKPSNSDPPAISPPFPWWSRILANASLPPQDPTKKHLLLVAQGTVETNPADLILPTIRAFARDPRVLVLAILGWRGRTLSPSDLGEAEDETIPDNVFVADYLSYHLALPHAALWIHNGGFGAVNHGIAHGVPMVVAGEGMDKTENARRVAWSGIGVDLGTATPSVGTVRDGVERVLGDSGFTSRVNELRRESEVLDCFQIVETAMEALALQALRDE